MMIASTYLDKGRQFLTARATLGRCLNHPPPIQMTQQHRLQVPSEVREEFLKQCGFYSEETPGFIDNEKFSELCATWGSDQEYQASCNFIDDAWGSDHARVYQESRRPKILSEKEEAREALYYLLYWVAADEADPEKYEKIKKYGNVLSELIRTLPDGDRC